ncbi:uncharacterized protein LOC143008745 isoform X2 [Genypterus blacodes]|uniref:uncharacterized protein LOC143008745 isoform X2 n=1 Tax=Genypterus blacodes TaxID=154954 RepID=UPI003F7712CE
MISYYLLNLCLFSLTQATFGLQLSDHLVMFASLGDSITLPCVIPSCSSIDWNMIGQHGLVTRVVVAGRLSLVKHCSLHINHLEIDDARDYTCHSGTFNSSVSVQILEISQTSTEKAKIELHCSLNTFVGLVPTCPHSGINIEWLTEAETHINGSRFHIKEVSKCFSVMTINLKPTDHQRKWKCQLTQRDSVKASTTTTTTIEDGIQEVFAAVGESVSFSCGNTSSLGVGDRMQWALGGKPLTEDISPVKGQTEPFHVNKDFLLVISKVSAMHSGNYQCSFPTDDQKVTNKIRLHTVDITSESNPEGDNLTLTCMLTCAATQCEPDFNLTWSGNIQHSWRSKVTHVNNTLISKLFLPDPQKSLDQFSCSVSREEVIMATKKWQTVNKLQTATWSILPLGLLLCAVTGGICVYIKRKHNKDAENKQAASVGMTNIYETVEDVNNEEIHQQSQRQRSTTSDSFYDLLQAVN